MPGRLGAGGCGAGGVALEDENRRCNGACRALLHCFGAFVWLVDARSAVKLLAFSAALSRINPAPTSSHHLCGSGACPRSFWRSPEPPAAVRRPGEFAPTGRVFGLDDKPQGKPPWPIWHKRCIASCTSPRWREWDAPSINGDRLATTGPGEHDCVRPTGRQYEQAKAPGTFWFRAFFFAFEKPDWL